MGRGNENLKSKQQNSSEEDERPFKKARHVWQIKGKYHLKEATTSVDNYKSGESSKSSEDEFANNRESDVSVPSNHKIHTPSDLIDRAEKLMDSEDSSEDESITQNIEKSISDEIPVTLVEPNPKSQDYYLQKWQARQVAKSFVDNTINRVLESWKIAPFDATDFVENCENDSLVEDRGILMAIQSHGLQSNLAENDAFARGSLYRGDFEDAIEQRPNLSESDLENYQNVQNELMKTESNDALSDPTSFLDAAVSFAIQKKGLTSHSYV